MIPTTTTTTTIITSTIITTITTTTITSLLTVFTLLCLSPALGAESQTDVTHTGNGVVVGSGGANMGAVEVVRVGKEEQGPQITWGRPNTKTAYFHRRTPTNVTAVVGQRAVLPCRVLNLDHKDVSWIRQRDLHILTVGIYTYTTDNRFKVYHPVNSDEFYLEVSPVTFRDAGIYECQVSGSPKIFLPVLLSVQVQRARIQGPHEVVVQSGSTIKLTCLISSHSQNVGTVTWFRNNAELDYDSPRGGVSIEIEKTPSRTTSKLFLTRAQRGDSGNYTCAPEFADASFVTVHVVTGEESAAVHTANSAPSPVTSLCVVLMVMVVVLMSDDGDWR